MVRVYEQLDDRLGRFLRRQRVFFVATAPVSPDGRVTVQEREALVNWSLAKGGEGFAEYRAKHNATSVYNPPGPTG
jgi:hypothetical protein